MKKLSRSRYAPWLTGAAAGLVTFSGGEKLAAAPVTHLGDLSLERQADLERYGFSYDHVLGPSLDLVIDAAGPADAIRAVQITTRFPAVHGSPVHLGMPELIGIKDIMKPDYGDPAPINKDEMPVFWACGVTPQSVVDTVKPEFCITHYPGTMLVTDRKNTEFAIM